MSPKRLLHGAQILTMDARRRRYQNGAIQIEGDRIVAIGPSGELLAQAPVDAEQVDLQGRWILPGLINTHVHTSQQLGRGIADDVDLLTWLRQRVWPYESHMSEEDSYISSLLCGVEQIRSGVTCFAEPGGQFVSGMVRAVEQLGLRAALAKSTMDMGEGLPANWQRTTAQELDAQLALYERWHGSASGRIRIWFGLRTIFNCSDELIVRSKELADRLGTGMHMHVAEIPEEIAFARQMRGAPTVTHLNALQVLGANLLAAHCVWLTDEEIALFAEKDVKVSHNPAAAMRVLGFAHIPEMLDAGVCVALGTDGAPCNNRMTLIDEMWLASLINKGRLHDPTVLPAEKVLEMVTCDGARAVLWEDEIGSLEAGKKADLVVINPNSATMLPMHDPVANMVSSMREHNVESVMCDGKWLMRDREIVVADEAEILAAARQHAQSIARRAGVRLTDRFNIVD